MEQISSSLDLIKQMKCSKHKNQILGYIDLTGESQSGRLCKMCIKQKKIPVEQCQSISELFESKEGEILSFYPPLKNQQIREQIQKYSSENALKDNIDALFHKLREDIEEAIKQAENRAKRGLIQSDHLSQKLYDQWKKIAETNKLKDLLSSDSKDLNKFLKKKWKDVKQNEQKIEKCISEIKGSAQVIDLIEKQDELKHLIESLSGMSLFFQEENEMDEINCFQQNEILDIEKQVDQIIITNNSPNSKGICYLDKIIYSWNKVVIQLEISSPNNKSCFGFGLVHYCKDQSIDSEEFFCHQYLFNQDKKMLEFRIDIANRDIQAFCPPDFKRSSDMDGHHNNGNQYDFYDYGEYYFVIEIKNSGDSVKILKVFEVDSFNYKNQ